MAWLPKTARHSFFFPRFYPAFREIKVTFFRSLAGGWLYASLRMSGTRRVVEWINLLPVRSFRSYTLWKAGRLFSLSDSFFRRSEAGGKSESNSQKEKRFLVPNLDVILAPNDECQEGRTHTHSHTSDIGLREKEYISVYWWSWLTRTYSREKHELQD